MVARLECRARRHARGVGAHVRDETDRLVAELDTLVQVLRDAHRPLRAEAKLLRRFLLERAGREWRGGILPALAALRIGDREKADRALRAPRCACAARSAQRVSRNRGHRLYDALRRLLVRNLGLLAVEMVQPRGELLAVL